MEQIIGGAPPGAADLVKDTTTQSFAADVLDASREVPVIVDFWAPWCGPCKQLGPLLEKAVHATRGAVKLVKLNIDTDPEIPQQMRVQSIPAVFAFKDGRPVDGFVGALPESQIKSFIDRLTGGQSGDPVLEGGLEQAREALAAGDHNTAGALFGQIHQHDPTLPEAIAGLARCLLARGEKDQARQLLDSAPEEAVKDAQVAAARTALELAEAAADQGEIPGLQQKLAGNENDHQTRYDLALAYYAAERREEAVDALLEIIRRDRKWNDEAARKQLIKLFEAFGPTEPLTVESRRKLSALLFS